MNATLAARTPNRPLGRAAALGLCLCLCVDLGLVRSADAQPADASADTADVVSSRLNLEAVQGILSVQRLDGWLLYDREGQNPIAREIVNPAGAPIRRWFYFVPVQGQPIAVIHRSEARSFEHVPGRKIEYRGYRDLQTGLRTALKGVKTVAMEYSPKATLPSMSLVDAGTVELVRAQGVKIRSSSDIVQFAKSLWGPAGRMSHYVAVHHLDALRKDALAFIAAKVKAGAALTERDVQARISRGYRIRGLDGPPPMVAVNSNAADPHYTPSKNSSALIKKGDLVLLDLAARVDGGDKRTIFAEMTWMAYVGETVPPRYRTLFEAVAQARDAGIDLIENRSKRRRAIKGFEVDQKVRSVIGKAGFADAFVHRTGHSLDTRVHGDGANLDDYETHDTRNLVMGSGFTIEPGIYVKGDVGVRTGVAVYIGRQGVEVTTPVQTEITAILSAR